MIEGIWADAKKRLVQQMTVFVSTSVRTSECVCVFACLSVSFHPFLMLSMSSVSRCIIIEMILTTHLNQLLHTKDQAHTYTQKQQQHFPTLMQIICWISWQRQTFLLIITTPMELKRKKRHTIIMCAAAGFYNCWYLNFNNHYKLARLLETESLYIPLFARLNSNQLKIFSLSLSLCECCECASAFA